jgi:ATP-dependent Clp protease adaptor protein ClpS
LTYKLDEKFIKLIEFKFDYGVVDMGGRTIFKEEIKDKVKRPKMYKVILLNDDYTPMDFVVEVIVKIFHKNVIDATKIMTDVHKKGKGIVGIFPYDIAVTKVTQVGILATENGYPLKSGIEEG